MSALKVGTGSVSIMANKNIIQLAHLMFPSSLKINCNNLKQFLEILSKTNIENFLIGPGAGLNRKIFEITCTALKKIKYVVLDGDSLSIFKINIKNYIIY